MKLIEQSHEIIAFPPDALHLIELAGRTCYRSEPKGSPGAFVRRLRDKGHHSVLEHASVTVRIVTSRAVTHELVRHRIASFSQESQRYVKFSGEIEFIQPVWWRGVPIQEQALFAASCAEAERAYHRLLAQGRRPEEARDVLPNAISTRIVVTANMREWMHIFALRTARAAYPPTRELMLRIQADFIERWPDIFEGAENTL